MSIIDQILTLGSLPAYVSNKQWKNNNIHHYFWWKIC